MTNVARQFDEHGRDNIFRSISSRQDNVADADLPWQKIRDGELPPMMFQIRFRNGSTISYTFSDLREIRMRDSGHLQLLIHSMSKKIVTIEGRHLRELATLIGTASIRWLKERDDRDVDRPEGRSEIVSIQVEDLEN